MLPLIWQLLLLTNAVSAQPSWAKLPVRSPPYLLPDRGDMPYFWWHYVQILVGDPPQAQELAVNLQSQVTFLYAPNCTYCPYHNNYQPLLSSSLRVGGRSLDASIFRAKEIFELLRFGSLTSHDSPIGLVKFMIDPFWTQNRPREGLLGLFNHPQSSPLSGQSFLTYLQHSGQLLNPVIGINFGGSNPSLSIGALDPADYEGEINWVQAPSSQNDIAIPVEAIRGFQGTIHSLPYPILAALDSTIPNIHLPGILDFLTNKTLLGPNANFWQMPSNPYVQYYLNCSINFDTMDFSGINLPFSVDINGVNYPVESKDMIRPSEPTRGRCDAAFQNTTKSSSVPVRLGLPFLRSVYLAYRFPTDGCPYAHYGFAFPKGLNRTTQTTSQTPRTKPEHSSQCLQFTSPTTTPSSSNMTPVIKPGQETSRPDSKTWKVYGSPDQRVVLRGAGDLPDVVERRLAFRV